MAIFATLIAIFYTEEDWRGKRAWKNCKRELEAKGAVLDWNAYIPAPVPDDQNFFTASTNIMLRFKKSENDAESALASQSLWLRITYSADAFPIFDTTKTGPLVVAELSVLPSNGIGLESVKDHLVVNLNFSGAREQIQRLVEATIGQSIHGAAGFRFPNFNWATFHRRGFFCKQTRRLPLPILKISFPLTRSRTLVIYELKRPLTKGFFGSC